MNKKQRAIYEEEFYRLIWESLESHLKFTYEKDNGWNGQKWHKKCVRDYVRMMELLKILS